MFNFNRTTLRGARFSDVNAPAGGGQSSMMAPLLILMLLAFVAPRVAYTQVLYGSLTGNVTDQKGATVPGAKIEVTNVNTGDIRSVSTDERGAYTLSDLQVGVYKITIAMSSFKTALKEDVRIEANKVHRYDAQLEVGDVNETVVVTAGQETTLQTDRGDVETTRACCS